MKHLRVVGVLERRNPLPHGRYWITVTSSPSAPNRLDNFRAWAASNAQLVIIDVTEPVGQGTANGAFFIFTVLEPLKFDTFQFGFPNVAGPEIQHADDTVKRPPKPTPLSALDEFFQALQASGVTTIAFIGIAAFVLLKGDRK